MKNIIRVSELKNGETRKQWEARIWHACIRQAADLPANELLELFSIITTPHERHSMLMRLAAIDRLTSGASYKQIGRELWLIPQTVSAIKRALKEKNYLSYNERGKTERKPFPKNSPLPDRKPHPHYGKTRHRTKYMDLYY